MDSLDILTLEDAAFPDHARNHHADGHLVFRKNAHVVAKCSLWWTATPFHENKPIGAIGHYEAANQLASEKLLIAAFQHLRGAGVKLAVGPLDGNTWRSYRFITELGDEPPFFLEPNHPPSYPQNFLTAGFRPMAEYFSALCSDLTIVDPRLIKVEARLADEGLTIRPLDLTRFEHELSALFSVSVLSFVDNFLYTPIAEAVFLAQYFPLRDLIDPRLILLAEIEGHPVGYVFGLPDLAQKQRGVPVDTAILKTVACLPGRRFAGLGALLVGKFHAAARERGFQRVIHALMHESNNSRNLSGIYTTAMRRYTLFSREL